MFIWLLISVLKDHQHARRIVGKMTKHEYLAWQIARGTMPYFNQVFDEFVIHHEEYEVPVAVIAVLEKKKKDAAAKNMTAAAEAKKWKGGGAAKTTTRNQGLTWWQKPVFL